MTMTTRAQNFAAKIKILRDYQAKLSNAVSPPPPGSDIANTLKNFSQTLLGFLKDCPALDPESLGGRSKEFSRLHNTFPNLCYSELYYAVIYLLDVMHNVQSGQAAAYEAILTILAQLIPFLEVEILETMPYTVACMLPFLPQQLCRTLVDCLTNVMFPLILRWSEELESYATESLPAILTMVFQYVEKPELHSQVVECLMGLKRDLSRDLAFVAAHGPTETRLPAVTMLFHYWPELLPQNANILQALRLSKYKHEPWQAIVCERPECPNKNNKASRSAAKMTISPKLCLVKENKSPPFYLCLDCADALAKHDRALLIDVLGPMKALPLACESKTCRSGGPGSRVHSTCFSAECAHLSGGRPIRLCEECHGHRHSHAGRQHVTQTPLPDIWDCPVELQQYMLESIVSLILEAQVPKVKTYSKEKGDEDNWYCLPEDAYPDNLSDKDRKILSIYGVILIVEKCKPRETVSIEILGRILAALFLWFDNTKLAEDSKGEVTVS
ncbi:hypothetical protein BOX15_Mlig011963g1 [Macrostomum lignano]|uniref:Uncharacterized protein n=1 Tax=Macrostomum lignano TaxID=282301 RepID=A0A267EWT0_9PLAT|nr:hypothetical protein BOX15_Mlig011963g1 [Macrostomum lignano]